MGLLFWRKKNIEAILLDCEVCKKPTPHSYHGGHMIGVEHLKYEYVYRCERCKSYHFYNQVQNAR
jgi:hypothetical protein